MTAVMEDSLSVPAVGRQFDSKKESMPAYSFGTGTRDAARLKMYTSAKHEKKKNIVTSPGPVYSVPSTVGDAPRFGFGSDEQRKHPRAKYPDSSVDLTCSVVDSQVLKFHSTPGVTFGTESRLYSKNAEIVRVHPGTALGVESPGALEYSPDESQIAVAQPEYSFGPKVPKLGEKCPPRMRLPLSATPRHVGPGSHMQPSGLGAQPVSARASAPSWGFGSEKRSLSEGRKQLLDTTSDISSIGKQVVSNRKSGAIYGFGASTRDQVARTHMVTCESDKGPTARLPKPAYHIDLPKPGRCPPKPGL